MATRNDSVPSAVAMQPARTGGGFGRASERLLGRDWRIAYLFILPTVALMVGLVAYPFFYALYLSFHQSVGRRVGNFVGLYHYISLWEDPIFREAVWLTFRFTVLSVFFKFWIGLAAALMLHQKIAFRNIFTALVLLPWIVPEVVTALSWRGIFDPVFGGLNGLLLGLGVIDQGIAWLGEPTLALASVIAVNVWKGIPFFTVTLLAGLKAIDGELYDASAVDGANAWQRFLHITLPGLRYVIIVCTLLSTIWTFNNFGIIYLLTGGGPGGATRVYTILAYEMASALRYGAGTAVALTMAPVLGIIILFLGRYMMQSNQRVADDGGALGGVLRVISWPFRFVFGLLGKVFWAINNAIEAGFRWLGGTLRRATGREAVVSHRASKRIGRAFLYVGLGALLFFELFPFYWVIITAFKTPEQIRSFRNIYWPDPIVTDNFQKLLTTTQFTTWFWNTVLVAVVAMAASVLVAALGAYALARLKWRGSNVLSTGVLIAYLMPGVLMLIPLFQILVWLGLINSLGALMLTYPTFTLPFAIWMLLGYYRAIPEELEEAAMIDGANRFQTFFQIILPLVRPALLAVALFSITGSFNEFLFAYVFVFSERDMTIGVGMAKMVIGDIFPFGLMSAAAIMMAIPVIILYTFAQKVMVEGLTAGSVKG